MSFIVKLVSLLPFGVLHALSSMLYYLLCYVVRYRRTIVRRNLVESFPQKDKKEIRRIEKRFYRFFVDMALESCKLLSLSPEKMKRHMRFTNVEIVNDLLARGRNVSLFIGHHGNWEWVSSLALWLDRDVTVVQIYHKLRNKKMNTLINRMRERMGHKGVEMYQTVRYVTTAVRSGKPNLIGFIADQSPKKREVKDFLTFLNHEVPVLTGTEKLTKHFGFEAVFLKLRRVKRGYYEGEFCLLHDDPKSLPDYKLTELYYKHIEEEIAQQPELYLWSHNRFKHAKQSSPSTNS